MYAVTCHEYWPLCPGNHFYRLRHIGRIGHGARLATIVVLVEVTGKPGPVGESRVSDLCREIQMHDARNAALEIAERIAGIFINTLGRGYALAVLADAQRL